MPAFRKPKSRNAATTLLLLGGIAITLFMGIIMLARATGVQIAERPHEQLVGAPANYHQKTLVAQLADAVFHDFPIGLFLIAGVTALILVLAANTAFNGFPVLGSILAQDRYLPRQLHTRGDRLAFSNGILFLAVRGGRLRRRVPRRGHRADPALHRRRVRVVHAQPDRHGPALDPAAAHRDRPVVRRKMKRSRVINTIGFICTGTVLIIVVVTKFVAGAWIAILAMVALFVIMKSIHKHYDTVARELERAGRRGARRSCCPAATTRSCWCPKCTCRRCGRWRMREPPGPTCWRRSPSASTTRETRELVHKWEDSDITVPLKVIASPYREITRPVLEYVRRVSKESPRTVVTVFIPEYVVGHWWEQVLHNQSALRLKGRLLFMPNVMVTSVPWQLSSSERLKTLEPQAAPGDTRRGFLD